MPAPSNFSANRLKLERHQSGFKTRQSSNPQPFFVRIEPFQRPHQRPEWGDHPVRTWREPDIRLLRANVERSRYQRTETAAEIDAIVKGVRDVLHPSVLATMKKVRQRFFRLSFSGGTHDHLICQDRLGTSRGSKALLRIA